MRRNNPWILLATGIVLMISIYLVTPNPQVPFITREVKTYLGLDLVGGIQTLLEADLPAGTEVDSESMRTARQIIENRVNALGVSEAVVQLAGTNRIVVELPGVDDPEQAVATIRGTALMEWVDLGQNYLPPGTIIKTNLGSYEGENQPDPDPAIPLELLNNEWKTILTGAELVRAFAAADELGNPVVSFELNDTGSQIFAAYTTNNVGSILAIVLDKEIISAPQVNTPITNGLGQITGNFTSEEANALAVQLRYGALPIPLRVIETRTIGPSLGQDSLNKSLIAGVIGVSIVMTFMALYYRAPGLIADLSLMIYAVLTFALFRTIPITLTLAGIAGLMLSTGSALDANILIFERLKEELRSGKTLRQSIELGWQRAWPSIRDSNIATLITCAILFWFGSAFGATIVKGFAVTLFVGVLVSLLSAIVVTRSLMSAIFEWLKPTNLKLWFGL